MVCLILYRDGRTPAIEREITQSTQPQGDVHVIPIENDTDTSNSTNSIKCCSLGANGSCCCCIIGMLLILSLFFVLLYVSYGIAPQKVR